jgi:putative transposase
MMAFIDEHKDEFGVEPICSELPIAPQTYYAAKSRPPSTRSITDMVTLAKIASVHEKNYGVYGARKVHAQLKREGHPVARCTVERLMRNAGLRGILRTKGPRTTIPGPATERPGDLVERIFTAEAPDQLWVADIERHEAFLNLAVVKGHRFMPVAAGV